MYNSAIVNAPTILFLGAGATHSLGKKTMTEFIDYLVKERGFEGEPLTQIIAKKKDLEFLFEQLEDICQMSYVVPTPILPSIIGLPAETAAHREFREGFENLVIQAQNFLERLREEVYKAYRMIGPPNRIVSVFKPLIEAAFNKIDPVRNPLVVFTTNYDPAIEEFCEALPNDYHLEDGFHHDADSKSYIWQRSQFDSYAVNQGKKNIVLFKLHGSANWTKSRKGIVKSVATIFVKDDSVHQNVLIYPATRKVAIEDPYFTAYDYFRRTVLGCHCCVVIGYSFHDYDMLTGLKSASAANPKLRTLVIDPMADKIAKELERNGIKAEPVQTIFGDERFLAAYVSPIATCGGA